MNEVLKIPALKFPVQAELSLPGSKSQANRAIICAALAEGVTEIQNATSCDDVAVMIENLQKMGFNLEWKDQAKGDLRIKGSQFSLTPDPSHDGGWGKKSPFSPREKGLGMRELDCNNAGTTLRFLTSLACLIPGEWTITGDENMRCRPIADLTAALRLLGADIKEREEGLIIHQSALKGNKVRGHNDHRIVMALSLAGLIASGKTEITTAESIGVTFPGFVDMMKLLGAKFQIVKI